MAVTNAAILGLYIGLGAEDGDRDSFTIDTEFARKVLADLESAATLKAESDAKIAELEAEVEKLRAEVEHWRTKATCYGNIVHGCSPALEKAGFPVDSSTNDGAVGGIRRAVESMAAELDAAKARWTKLRSTLRQMQRDCSEGGSDWTAIELVIMEMDDAPPPVASPPVPERPPMLLAKAVDGLCPYWWAGG